MSDWCPTCEDALGAGPCERCMEVERERYEDARAEYEDGLYQRAKDERMGL